ncbi:MAG: siphovirus Gp157 family protein [Ruminococcus sp.]|nr:siphovirus Gp157 family protein [Ruminococcus sp.]
MAHLYEISGQFAQLFDEYEEIIDDITETGIEQTDAEQVWFDTLSGMEGEFELKAESVAQYIKSLLAMAEDIKDAEKCLAQRRKVYENKAARMKLYLKNCMEQMKLKKVETARAKIMLRNNAASLSIADERAFAELLQELGRDDLLNYSEPTIRKNEVKALIKSGEKFDGVELVTTQSIIIS